MRAASMGFVWLPLLAGQIALAQTAQPQAAPAVEDFRARHRFCCLSMESPARQNRRLMRKRERPRESRRSPRARHEAVSTQ
jgi:hypothetical protein